MVIFQTLFGLKEPLLLFDVVLHAGTLLATLVVFYKEILKLLQSPRAILLLVVGSIPTAAIGLSLATLIETQVWYMNYACMGLILTGILLFASRFVPKKSVFVEGPLFSYISVGQAFLIGLAQGIAIFPGISRSGITITSALFLGSGRKDAATFSFLLSIPSILGALFLKLYKTPALSADQLSLFSTGFLLSFVIGTLSLVALVKIVLKGNLYQFCYYCWIVGILGLVAHYTIL